MKRILDIIPYLPSIIALLLFIVIVWLNKLLLLPLYLYRHRLKGFKYYVSDCTDFTSELINKCI